MPKRTAAPQLTLEGAWQSFDRSLRAEGRSPETRRAYAQTVALFGAYLSDRGLASEVALIDRADLEGWIITVLDSRKPATAATRHHALARLFSWLVAEGELDRSPMQRMEVPKVPENPPTVLSIEDMRRILAVCKGTDFDDRRDAAILRVLVDTGLRLAELTGLTLDDVDLDEGLATVTGKGRRRRAVPLGAKSTAALDRYLRVRHGHPHHRSSQLWLGQKGPLTATGMRQVVQRRARRHRATRPSEATQSLRRHFEGHQAQRWQHSARIHACRVCRSVRSLSS
jgi:site-specific recombinase XerC